VFYHTKKKIVKEKIVKYDEDGNLIEEEEVEDEEEDQE